jgi:hypothetical protein
VRVTANHLGGDPLDDVARREGAVFAGELRQEHDLEEEIAQLFAQRGKVGAVERVHDLVALLDQEPPQRRVGLLAVPRASPGVA